eukprot:NODE_6399_length_1675_cov_5.689922.p4 GENE.NODE_6399_length_1675_cov_5.689922~~NODE_6399_length_1675_cov_5.689922.p4  ORF type:complete len:167 (-),score=33.20 NODE_6399_length_1675_cov_5.689922:186-686(-)
MMELHEAHLRDSFKWMMNSMTFLYLLLYPWGGSQANPFVLVFVCAFMCFAFYGLRLTTEQLENPMTQQGQGFNIALTFEAMFLNMEIESQIRQSCSAFIEARCNPNVELSHELHDEFVDLLSARLHCAADVEQPQHVVIPVQWESPPLAEGGTGAGAAFRSDVGAL